jgi:hypothetical protein
MHRAQSGGWLGLWLLIGLALCGGCQSKPRYGWVYDKQADFSGLKAYHWLPVEQKGTAGRDIGGEPIDQLVQIEVQRTLAAKGFTPSAQGSPADFTVQCTTVLEFQSSESANLTAQRDPSLDRTEWYAVESSDRAVEPCVPSSYTVGTLYITMRVPKAEKVLWRGVASGVLHEKDDPQKRIQRVHNAIDTLLAKFPPPPAEAR